MEVELMWSSVCRMRGKEGSKGSLFLSYGECHLLEFSRGRRTLTSNWEEAGGEPRKSGTKSSGEEREEVKNIC